MITHWPDPPTLFPRRAVTLSRSALTAALLLTSPSDVAV